MNEHGENIYHVRHGKTLCRGMSYNQSNTLSRNVKDSWINIILSCGYAISVSFRSIGL